MLNRKLTLALFIFVFLIVWGVVFYDYYKKQNSVSDQNILTGNVISDLGNLDTFQLSPINLKKCILSSQCGSGNKCDKGYCRPYVSCKVKGKKLPLNSYCLSPPLGSNAYGVCGNSGYCQAECQKDKDCKRSKNGDLCNIQYGRCADCIKDSSNSKYKCKNPEETCNDYGECVAPTCIPQCFNKPCGSDNGCGNGGVCKEGSGCTINPIGCGLTNNANCPDGKICIDKNRDGRGDSCVDRDQTNTPSGVPDQDGLMTTTVCTPFMILLALCGASPTDEPPPGYKICDLNKKAKSATCKLDAECGSTGGGVFNPLPDVNFCDETSKSCKSPNVLCPVNEDAKGNICCPGSSGCEVSTLGLPYCTKKDGCKKGDEGYCADDLCCSEKEECKKGYGAAVCQPKEENSCDSLKETFCPGLPGSQGEERKKCCPKDTCRHMGNGYPYCYNP